MRRSCSGPECVSLLRVYTVVAVGMEFVNWLYFFGRPLMVTLEGVLFIPFPFLCLFSLPVLRSVWSSGQFCLLRHLRPQPCLGRTSSLWVAFFLVSSLRWCSSSW